MRDMPSVHSNEYWRDLKAFRDAALEQSHCYGRRRSVGALACGRAKAVWHTADDGYAVLEYVGLSWHSKALDRIYNTLFNISWRHDSGTEWLRYKIDIDDVGLMKVQRVMINRLGLREVVAAQVAALDEWRFGLHVASDEDRQYVYRELKRGASGIDAED